MTSLSKPYLLLAAAAGGSLVYVETWLWDLKQWRENLQPRPSRARVSNPGQGVLGSGFVDTIKNRFTNFRLDCVVRAITVVMYLIWTCTKRFAFHTAAVDQEWAPLGWRRICLRFCPDIQWFLRIWTKPMGPTALGRSARRLGVRLQFCRFLGLIFGWWAHRDWNGRLRLPFWTQITWWSDWTDITKLSTRASTGIARTNFCSIANHSKRRRALKWLILRSGWWITGNLGLLIKIWNKKLRLRYWNVKPICQNLGEGGSCT